MVSRGDPAVPILVPQPLETPLAQGQDRGGAAVALGHDALFVDVPAHEVVRRRSGPRVQHLPGVTHQPGPPARLTGHQPPAGHVEDFRRILGLVENPPHDGIGNQPLGGHHLRPDRRDVPDPDEPAEHICEVCPTVEPLGRLVHLDPLDDFLGRRGIRRGIRLDQPPDRHDHASSPRPVVQGRRSHRIARVDRHATLVLVEGGRYVAP